jgi:hypothetical protein
MPAHLIMPAYIKIPMAKVTVTNSHRGSKKKTIKWITFIYSVKDIQNIMKHCRNNNNNKLQIISGRNKKIPATQA